MCLFISFSAGEAHTSIAGKEIPAKIQTVVECRCQCCRKFTEEERDTIFTRFYELADHEKQNIYLRGCVRAKEDNNIRRRGNDKGNTAERRSFVYTITVGPNTQSVCRNSFCALHGIKKSRLEKKVLKTESTIQDGRGKHDNHTRIDEDIRNRIRQHISNFPARESHYSRSKQRTRKYLDASLNISAMYRMFLKDNPDLTEQTAKRWLYQDIFTHEFNISFGFPRSDICDKCEWFYAQMKAAESDGNVQRVNELKVQHELHIRKADVFNKQMQDMSRLGKDDMTKSRAVICMDYQKNLPLPLTGVGQEYYKRQLWLHNLCIHNMVDDDATMYLYSEHYAGKGPNEVISCLDDYIKDLPQSVTALHVFTDNCFSQNKNKYLCAYLNYICNVRLMSVHVYYPIPGHSRMPCDRDFGRIEQKKKHIDRVSRPSEWVETIRTTDIRKPFTIKYVEHPVTDDLRSDGTPVVKVKDYKTALEPHTKPPKQIAATRGIVFERGKVPVGRQSMTGMCNEPMAVLKRGSKMTNVKSAVRRARDAFADFIPIKDAKLRDVNALLEHVHLPPSVTFYHTLTGIEAADSDEDEME